MSTHSHFVLWCETLVQAQEFSIVRVPAEPKEIYDVRYLKNCIAYVLLNPVIAGVVKRPEDYKFVERLFGGQTEFYEALALTDSITEETKYGKGDLAFLT